MENKNSPNAPTKFEAPEEYEYQLGLLTQWCSRFDEGCDWKDERLKKELTNCPKCGESVSGDCILTFGGTTMKFQKKKSCFLLESGNFPEAIIYEADFPDTIVFMLRHGNFWRR